MNAKPSGGEQRAADNSTEVRLYENYLDATDEVVLAEDECTKMRRKHESWCGTITRLWFGGGAHCSWVLSASERQFWRRYA